MNPDRNDWKKYIDVDLPQTGEITSEVVERNSLLLLSGRYIGDVRIALGMVWTDKEYESYRERVLSTPLP